LLNWLALYRSSAATDGLITSKVLSRVIVIQELIDDFEMRIKPGWSN